MTAYMVFKMQTWDSLEHVSTQKPAMQKPPLVNGSRDCIGFAPIFSTFEAAYQFCDGKEWQIKEVEVSQESA